MAAFDPGLCVHPLGKKSSASNNNKEHHKKPLYDI